MKENEENIETCLAGDIFYDTLMKAYYELDNRYLSINSKSSQTCGAAVASVLIVGNILYCANLGDCRAVLCRNNRAVNLSKDQKASDEAECHRVMTEGGLIVGGRVAGRLAITRAIGDFSLKRELDEHGVLKNKQYLSCIPEIRVTEL
jgi:serine/threonine protein phosphatase PrpC